MTTQPRIPGVIRADESYTVDEFRLRAGLGDYTWRQVRKGLQVIKVGKKRYVRGSDWLAFLGRAAEEPEAGNPTQKLADGETAG